MIVDLIGSQIVLVAGVLGAIAALYRIGKSIFLWALREHERQEALTILARQVVAIQAILASELLSNNGKSIKDAVARIAGEVSSIVETRLRSRAEIDHRLEKIEARLEDICERLNE